jgi:hypothetical protein
MSSFENSSRLAAAGDEPLLRKDGSNDCELQRHDNSGRFESRLESSDSRTLAIRRHAFGLAAHRIYTSASQRLLTSRKLSGIQQTWHHETCLTCMRMLNRRQLVTHCYGRPFRGQTNYITNQLEQRNRLKVVRGKAQNPNLLIYSHI